MVRAHCGYILASKRNGTLYNGVTGNLARRVWQHRRGAIAGFTNKYRVHMLVYVESHATMTAAIVREKQIKQWRRAWKIALIERTKPSWQDLYGRLLE